MDSFSQDALQNNTPHSDPYGGGDAELVLSVADCLALVNQTLEYAYPSVVVEGEIASYKVSKGKYVFFDIKDSEAVLGCFMTVYQLRQHLEDGMRVRVTAAPRLTPWGKFSLTVREICPVGQGSIKRSFELLRAKLASEGLFDESRKRILPKLPSRVGVIASVESAGYADFTKILNQRWGGVEVTVADVQVQGVAAAQQIINALNYFNQHAEPVEALVIARGGGSAEDLAVFNDELLVRAVAGSRIPTVVAVGHETDVSLCDLAADVRAATPSNAAQLLVPDRQAMLVSITHHERHMIQKLEAQLTTVRHRSQTAVDHMMRRLDAGLHDAQRRVTYADAMLRQLDPRVVLQRGYSIVRSGDRVVTGAAGTVQPGQQLTVETAHAIIITGVQDVRQKDSNPTIA